VHDNHQPNILLQNDGTGHFTDVSQASGTDYAGFGMGVDVGDINNDGWPDLYITNLSDNTMLLNQGDGSFQDISGLTRATDRGMGWGTTFWDFDNDGWLDIYAVNDSDFSPFPNVLYRNLGNLVFELVEQDQPISSLGAGYGSARADIDGDGRLDMALANVDEDGVRLFHNVVQTGNWLAIEVVGSSSNRSAIGTQINLKSGERVWSTSLVAGSGYASQNESLLQLGLGEDAQFDSLYVRWPNGETDVYPAPPINQRLRLVEGLGFRQLGETEFNLQLSPNPAQKQLEVVFVLPFAERLQLNLYDQTGRKVKGLLDEAFSEGVHRQLITLDAQTQPGLYHLQLMTPSGQESVKLVIQ
ncbi:MAG: FG-GAP-like repeat-containing protein, partial [Bacteroidota bacterium]